MHTQPESGTVEPPITDSPRYGQPRLYTMDKQRGPIDFVMEIFSTSERRTISNLQTEDLPPKDK